MADSMTKRDNQVLYTLLEAHFTTYVLSKNKNKKIIINLNLASRSNYQFTRYLRGRETC